MTFIDEATNACEMPSSASDAGFSNTVPALENVQQSTEPVATPAWSHADVAPEMNEYLQCLRDGCTQEECGRWMGQKCEAIRCYIRDFKRCMGSKGFKGVGAGKNTMRDCARKYRRQMEECNAAASYCAPEAELDCFF